MADYEMLVNLPTDDDGWEDENVYKIIIRFVAEYVCNIYGKRQIRQWLDSNKGSTFLNLLTISDIAYALTLIENSNVYWTQGDEISKMSREESDKYKKKNQGEMNNEDKKKYRCKELEFTGKLGKKTGYLTHGFRPEGIAFYKNMKVMWKKHLYQKRLRFEKLEVMWDNFVERTGWMFHFKDVEGMDMRNNGVENDDNVDEGNQMVMSDDDDFTRDCPIKRGDDFDVESKKGDDSKSISSDRSGNEGRFSGLDDSDYEDKDNTMESSDSGDEKIEPEKRKHGKAFDGMNLFPPDDETKGWYGQHSNKSGKRKHSE